MLTPSGEFGFKLFSSTFGRVLSSVSKSIPNAARLWLAAPGFGNRLGRLAESMGNERTGAETFPVLNREKGTLAVAAENA